MEKPKAIKGSNNQKQLLPRFIKLLLSVFSIELFLSSPVWLPSTLSVFKKIWAIAFGPKGLFVVCNIIIVILIGDSKHFKSSLQPDIYEEYLNRNKGSHWPTGKKDNDEEGNEFEKRAKVVVDEEEEEEEEVYGVEEVGEKGLDELNKRVEDFIARVNKQRKLEAKLIEWYG